MIVGGSGYGKTNTLLNLIKQQDDNDFSIIDNIYLYFKDTNEVKYQYPIKKRENNVLKNLEDPKPFIKYPSNMHDVY